MEDPANGALHSQQRAGYFQQYLARMAPTPLPPPPLPFPASSTRPKILSRAVNRPQNGQQSTNKKPKAKETTRKSLVDAFKQHGMKLCDGSKLNAVAKGVTSIGVIPPTLGVHITALYLSQNELRSLDGIVQFKSVRLLSLANNALARFSDVEQLQQLPQLRHLNLMGNPLCNQPNYRLRVIDLLRQLHILDTIEISKHERELAPLVASQDRALREMAIQNHTEIQKLQRLTVWIQVLSELQCLVIRDAITGRFDQLPSPQSGVNIECLLRVWRVEDTLSAKEREVLEAQMLAIIARTRTKLMDGTPQIKAKELLFKLANGSAASSLVVRKWNAKDKELPAEMRRECSVWEDAYVHVLQLQQQTIANLRGECERNRHEMVEKQRQLVVMNPHQRRQRAVLQQREAVPVNERPREPQARDQRYRDGNRCPDTVVHEPTIEDASHQAQDAQRSRPRNPEKTKEETAKPDQTSLRRMLRSGEFGNKTLHEAIHNFTLRQPSAPSRLLPPTRPTTRAKTTTSLQYAHASRSFIVSDEDQVDLQPLQEATVSKSRCDEFSDVDSCRMTATETVCSGDTRSISGFSMDHHDSPGRFRSDAVVTASSAQHSRQQDPVKQRWVNRPQELRTVCEDDERSQFDNGESDDEHQQPEQHNRSARNQGSRDAVSHHPRFLSDRQHELEAREEKYITALMESEQRELDLRQQVAAMHKQLASFQQSLSEKDRERRVIKAEIATRVSFVARPTMLRRFFATWIRHCHWARQLRHVQRKRQFIFQHDSFWNWRRKVWIQQQLRRIRQRQYLRLLRCHLTEWANLTRISVIAVHTQALRQSHLLQRIVAEWRQQTHVLKLMQCMQADQQNATTRQCLSTGFDAWRHRTRRSRQLRRLHHFYARHNTTNWKKLVLSKWKIFVLSIARPQRDKANALVVKRQAKAKTRYFMAWKSMTKCELLHQQHTRKRAWTLWRMRFQQLQIRRDRARSTRHERLRSHFVAWRSIGCDRMATQRALSLATRHLNHRRLRKLWMHWKVYSIARKRHMQGASKAFKHYFVKLLRKTWAAWKRGTRENAVFLRQNKHRELQFHFHALCDAVHRLRREKRRQVFVRHACTRRQLALVKKAMALWSTCTKRRRRCHALHGVLASQRSKALVGFVWSQWKHQHLVKLKHTLAQTKRHSQSLAEGKQDAEDELLEINDRSISLCEQIRQLALQTDSQSNDIKTYQEELLTRERAMVALEKQLQDTQRSEKERGQRLDGLEKEKTSLKSQIDELHGENQVLTAEITELKRAAEAAARSVDTVNEEKTTMQVRIRDLSAQNTEIQRTMEERERALRTAIHDLTQQLTAEQRERDDTVKRLQEYEARIASTCAEIGDHEKAHEQERFELRAEKTRLENLRQEDAVRNAELQRLLSEKNDQIIALSVRLNTHQSHGNNDPRTSPHPQPHAMSRSDEEQHKPWKERSSARDQEAVPESRSHSSSPVATLAVEQQQVLNSCAVDARPEREIQPQQPAKEIVLPITIEPSAEELQIDARTSRIHADIQLLQERISKRLQQIPCAPVVDDMASGRSRSAIKTLVFESDCGSISTISESEHDERELRKPRRTVRSGGGGGGGVLPTSQAVKAMATTTTTKKLLKATGRENVSRIANRPTRPSDTAKTAMASAPRAAVTTATAKRPLVSHSVKKRTSGRASDA